MKILSKALEYHGIAVLFLLIALYAQRPDEVAWLMAKERGLLEWGTPAVLLIGIIAIASAYRLSRPVPKAATLYFTIIALGMLYFLGEEISWGQHIFGWETPDGLARLNNQDETNIHNISSWFDQKPRTAVEIAIVVGTVVAAIHAIKKSALSSGLSGWIWPSASVIPTSLCFIVIKVADAAQTNDILPASSTLGPSEGAEYFVAVFLSIYAVGYSARVRELQRSTRSGAPLGAEGPRLQADSE